MWQPIETAPKDETEILILFDSATVPVVRLCWWRDGNDIVTETFRPDEVGWWSYQNSVSQDQIDWMKPVAWMPMPSPKGFGML